MIGILAPLPLWSAASKTLQAVNYVNDVSVQRFLIGLSVLLGVATGGIVGRLVGETMYQHRRGVRRARRDAPLVVVFVFFAAATLIYSNGFPFAWQSGKLDVRPLMQWLPLSVLLGSFFTIPAIGPALLLLQLVYFVMGKLPFRRNTNRI